MSKHEKTRITLEAIQEILSINNPMTVRQVYYQLVSRQVLKNERSRYQAVSRILADARKEGIIPWEWVEDRLRIPRVVSMWDSLSDFRDTVLTAYRRNTWEKQSIYLEAWLEKDALSGIFEDELNQYGITLNIGRGFDGWSSIYEAAQRYRKFENVTILYFGDFDPSGEDMVRSLGERLAFFGYEPELTKCALTYEDIKRYNLPPDFTKATDTRQKKFVEKYGDVAVELDALPVDILRSRIVSEVEARIDLNALAEIKRIEERERKKLARWKV